MFYEKLNNEELEDIKILEKETGSDYGINGMFVPLESWRKIAKDRKILIETLEEELEEKEKEFDSFKQNVEDNYKQIPYAEQIDYHEESFMTIL